MREQTASDKPVAGRDISQRKGVVLRRDLALEPRLVALARMLSRPGATAAMALADLALTVFPAELVAFLDVVFVLPVLRELNPCADVRVFRKHR